MNACQNCGAAADPDLPTPSHCGECPPWICDGCDTLTTMANPCSCWISLEGLPLADIKALFADDCDGPGLSLDPS